jgi:F420-dependent oxidoreductase-like protein
MAIRLGIHTGPQDLEMDELVRLWRRADQAGFHWISVWDHFYANPLVDRAHPCFEGVAAMTALAATTQRVRVGCLVFCALFRNPGLLAKAAVTVDHLSGGRAELGIGAGWFEQEFREFGYGFPPLGERLDQLEEALWIVRSLLRDPVTSFKGRYYELEGAVCAPKPRGRLRIWVGGRGERRTPRLAARFADGFNVPYLSPEDYRGRLEALDRACEAQGRDPATIERSVNVGFYMSADPRQAEQRKQALGHLGRAGMLVGTVQETVDRIGEYERAGAQGLNIAFRPPIDWDAFETFIAEVLPHFA